MKLFPLLFWVFTVQFLSAQTAFRPEANQKSDVVFSGVENPIAVEIAGVSNQNLQLLPSFGEIHKDASGNFLWKICRFDSSQATLIIKDLSNNRSLDTVAFKVKMIPPPDFELAKAPSDLPGHAEWRGGVAAVLQDFPIDVSCKVTQFEVNYRSKNQDWVNKLNKGWRFTGEARELIQKAKPGDKYTFSKFRFQCGCDDTERRHSQTLSWTIQSNP